MIQGIRTRDALPVRGRTADRRRFSIAALVLAATLFSSASCSSTSGSTYDRSTQGDSSAAAIAAQKKKEAPPPNHQPSRPNDQPSTGGSGPGPVVFGPPQPPPPPRGWIVVRGLPSGARLYVDGERFFGDRAHVPAGDRSVRAEAFGREPWSAYVTVPADRTVEIEAYMPAAPFRIDSLEASPDAFDPGAPGAFGAASIAWTASAQGRATLYIRNASGDEIYRKTDIAIDSRVGYVTWNGTDDSGETVPDGVYIARLEGVGDNGTSSVGEASVTVTPRAEPLRYSSLHGGFSGALFAPDARVLSEGHFQTSSGAYALFTPPDSSSTSRVPIFAGIRIGGLLNGTSELAASGMIVPYTGYSGLDPSWGSLAMSLKTRIFDGPAAAALLVSASFASFLAEASAGTPPDWDGPARYPGLGAGLVLETASRYTRVFGSAQVMASTYYPGWADLVWNVPGLFAWAYGRLGAEALLKDFLDGDLAVAASLAARTEPFGGGAGFRPPLSVGTELHWYLPGSDTVLSAYAVGEWEGFRSWYYAGGLGIGFAY